MDSSSPNSVLSSSIYLTSIPTSQMGDVGIGCSHRGLRRQSIFRSAVPVSEDCGCSGVIISHVLSSSSIYIYVFLLEKETFLFTSYLIFLQAQGSLYPLEGFIKQVITYMFLFPCLKSLSYHPKRNRNYRNHGNWQEVLLLWHEFSSKDNVKFGWKGIGNAGETH